MNSEQDQKVDDAIIDKYQEIRDSLQIKAVENSADVIPYQLNMAAALAVSDMTAPDVPSGVVAFLFDVQSNDIQVIVLKPDDLTICTRMYCVNKQSFHLHVNTDGVKDSPTLGPHADPPEEAITSLNVIIDSAQARELKVQGKLN